MPLMLMVIFLCIGLGLLARRIGVREHLMIAVLVTFMTGLYLFVEWAM